VKKLLANGSWALFLCLFFVHSAVSGEHRVSQLTDSNIRDFVYDMTDMANNAHSSSGSEGQGDFFAMHLHPNAFFKSSIIYAIPGFPQQENEITLNKEQYIENLVNSGQMMRDFSAEVSIQNIRISKDKTRATIETTTNEHATMLIPAAGMTEYVPMNGTSKCSEILMLSDNDVIQIYSANCTTKMSFEDIY